jgi:predicted metalloendopeptidase
VEPDAKDPEFYILRLRQSGIGLSDTSIYQQPNILNSYGYQIARLIARILKDVPGEDVNEIEPWMRETGRTVALFEASLADIFTSQ